MADEVTIKVMKNGAYQVKGPVKLLDADGNEMETKPVMMLCRCGDSKKMPFCDGQHIIIGFNDEK
jgi:CDGSH-type Zn-finger protein